jgi:hypothetical protein
MNIEAALKEAMNIDGAIGVSLVDLGERHVARRERRREVRQQPLTRPPTGMASHHGRRRHFSSCACYLCDA